MTYSDPPYMVERNDLLITDPQAAEDAVDVLRAAGLEVHGFD